MLRHMIRIAVFLFCLLGPALTGPAAALPMQRCINLSNALEAPYEGAWGEVITRGDMRAIAAAGFDTVRFPVRFSRDLPGPISADLFARVDEVIGWAQEDGLRVILDLHHFFDLMDAPDAHAGDFVRLWDQIAQHYAGAGDHLIFELLNEPEGALTTRKAEALFAEVVPRIRELHPKRWIILEGGDWADLPQMLRLRMDGPYIAHSFHYYAPFDFTHQGADWTDPPMPRGITLAEFGTPFVPQDIAQAKGHRVPVLLGEFGVTGFAAPHDRAAWLRAIRTSAEAAGAGWCVFGLGGPFGLYDGTEWAPGALGALGLPDK